MTFDRVQKTIQNEAEFHIQMGAFAMGPQGLPLIKPPYGTVNAVDLNNGTIKWQVPHGEGPTDHPAIKHLNLLRLGLGAPPSCQVGALL